MKNIALNGIIIRLSNVFFMGLEDLSVIEGSSDATEGQNKNFSSFVSDRQKQFHKLREREELDWDDAITQASSIWGVENDTIEESVYKIIDIEVDELADAYQITEFLLLALPHSITTETLETSTDFAVFMLGMAKKEGYSFIDTQDLIQEYLALGYETDARAEVVNFPDGTSEWEKAYINMIRNIGSVEIPNEVSGLTENDIEVAINTLVEGDVVLVGSLGHLSAVAIGGAVTHSLIYVGSNTFIHAIANGVELIHADEVFAKYDTMAITRPNEEFTQAAISYAYEQLGRPYDYDFNEGSDAFYCSELVASAYQNAGMDTPTPHLSTSEFGRLMNVVAIAPEDLIGSGFEPVFTSENLILRPDNSIRLNQIEE